MRYRHLFRSQDVPRGDVDDAQGQAVMSASSAVYGRTPRDLAEDEKLHVVTNTDLGGPLGSRDPRLLKTDLLEKVGEARPFDQGDAGMIAQFSLDEAAGGGGHTICTVPLVFELCNADANSGWGTRITGSQRGNGEGSNEGHRAQQSGMR